MTEKNWLHSAGDLIHLEIKAQPGASKTEIAGVKDGRLKVRIASAPEDGKANAELCRFLAKLLGCAKNEVTVLRGQKSRLKTLTAPRACEEKATGLDSSADGPTETAGG
jgi:uncharacterized protein (TIGR00251 family)